LGLYLKNFTKFYQCPFPWTCYISQISCSTSNTSKYKWANNCLKGSSGVTTYNKCHSQPYWDMLIHHGDLCIYSKWLKRLWSTNKILSVNSYLILNTWVSCFHWSLYWVMPLKTCLLYLATAYGDRFCDNAGGSWIHPFIII
jgi:hypothetical protein